MATGKRFYWIKLKESFMTSDTVDYFMSQPDGANYVVLYQMLCLKTINTDGRLVRQIGEVIIPYDLDKIQRDCKWFSADTIRVAMNLYKACGLIYEDRDGVLVMADHSNLVGSETDYAKQKKIQREKRLALPVDSGMDNVHTENRDKRLDIRDKRLEKDIEKSKKRSTTFSPPTLEEVEEYARSRNSPVDAKRFYDYYSQGDWKDAKGNKVKNWKQKLITWERRDDAGSDKARRVGRDSGTPEVKGRFDDIKLDIIGG